jgi:hypothetical protein
LPAVLVFLCFPGVLPALPFLLFAFGVGLSLISWWSIGVAARWLSWLLGLSLICYWF